MLEEIKSTEEGIEMLERVWRKLGLNVTPKCHMMFDHILDQVKEHKGITDLVEDYVEHAHQSRKLLDHLVVHMNSQCFHQQELVKIWRQWLANDPQVLKQLEHVKAKAKRKVVDSPLKRTIKKKTTVKKQLKRVKREATEHKIRKSLSAAKNK